MKRIWPYVSELKGKSLTMVITIYIPLKKFRKILSICRIKLWFACKQDLNVSWKIPTF